MCRLRTAKTTTLKPAALTNATVCVNYWFGNILKKACIPAPIQLRVTKGGARAAHFCGSVASGSGGVVRGFEDVDGLYRSEEAFDGHYWDNERAAKRAACGDP